MKYSKYELGMAFFAQLPPHAHEAVIEFARTAGDAASAEALAFHEKHVTGRPLMSFVVQDDPEYMFAALAGASAWLDDAISADWSIEKYKALYLRFGISDAEAQKCAEATYTADSGPMDMVTRLLRYVPDLPGELDDVAKQLLAKALNVLSAGVSSSLSMRKEDNLWEMVLCGEHLQRLRRRVRYKIKGDALAIPSQSENPYPSGADGKADMGALGQLASAVLPIVVAVVTRGRFRGSSGSGAAQLGQGQGLGGLLTGDLDGDESHQADDANMIAHAENVARIARAPAAGGSVEAIGDALVAASEYAAGCGDAESGDFLRDAASAIGSLAGNLVPGGNLIGAGINLLSGIGKGRTTRSGASTPGGNGNAAVLAALQRVRQDLTAGFRASRQDHAQIMRALRDCRGNPKEFLRQIGLQPRVVGPMRPMLTASQTAPTETRTISPSPEFADIDAVPQDGR